MAPVVRRDCEECGVSFAPKRPWQRFCSKPCRRTVQKRRQEENIRLLDRVRTFEDELQREGVELPAEPMPRLFRTLEIMKERGVLK